MKVKTEQVANAHGGSSLSWRYAPVLIAFFAGVIIMAAFEKWNVGRTIGAALNGVLAITFFAVAAYLQEKIGKNHLGQQ